MSANLFEKIFISSTIAASVAFMGAMYFKQPKVNKDDSFRIRQQLLKQDDAKMLYSTMSFFYLQGFHQKSIESFYTMQKILSIEKPNYIALPISKEQYDENYLKVIQHPKFRPAIDKFSHLLETHDEQGIKNMEEFDLANLEKLYLIDYCNKLKKCKIVFCRKPKEFYQRLAESAEKIRTNQQKKTTAQAIFGDDLKKIKVEHYTDILVAEMKPKISFSLVPQSPFKVIFGIVEPDFLKPVAARWKQKFFQNYNHEVIEDEAIVERQRNLKEAQGKSN